MAVEVQTGDSCEIWNAFISGLKRSFVHLERLHCIVCCRSLRKSGKRSNRADLGELRGSLCNSGLLDLA